MFIHQVKCTEDGRCWRDGPEVFDVVLCGKLDVGTFNKIPDPLVAISLQPNHSLIICICHLILVLADVGELTPLITNVPMTSGLIKYLDWLDALAPSTGLRLRYDRCCLSH